MEDSIKTTRRKGGGIYEDLESGSISIHSPAGESLIKMDKDILLQPAAGGKLKSTVPLEGVISAGGGGSEVTQLIPGAPAGAITPSTFPYFNYIVPVSIIAASAASLLIKTEK